MLLLRFTWRPQKTRVAAECLLCCCSSVAALLQLCCSSVYCAVAALLQLCCSSVYCAVAALLQLCCSTEDDEMRQKTREAAEPLVPSLTFTYAQVVPHMLTYAHVC
jgi:hypothetical protein